MTNGGEIICCDANIVIDSIESFSETSETIIEPL